MSQHHMYHQHMKVELQCSIPLLHSRSPKKNSNFFKIKLILLPLKNKNSKILLFIQLENELLFIQKYQYSLNKIKRKLLISLLYLSFGPVGVVTQLFYYGTYYLLWGHIVEQHGPYYTACFH
jgi:hypothetical protein